MGKSRRQDTGPERNEKDTIQKLKEIVRSQRNEISRLNKELNRRDDVSEDYKELLDEQAAREVTIKATKPSLTCPKCAQAVEEVPIGKFTLQRCIDRKCTWRKRFEK